MTAPRVPKRVHNPRDVHVSRVHHHLALLGQAASDVEASAQLAAETAARQVASGQASQPASGETSG